MSIQPDILIGCHPAWNFRHRNECLRVCGHLFLTPHLKSACQTVWQFVVFFLENHLYCDMILLPSDSTVPHAVACLSGWGGSQPSRHLSAAASSLLPIWRTWWNNQGVDQNASAPANHKESLPSSPILREGKKVLLAHNQSECGQRWTLCAQENMLSFTKSEQLQCEGGGGGRK